MAKLSKKASVTVKRSSASSSVVYLPQAEKNEQAEFAFGAVIRKYRNKNEMSQPELAELMGVSRNTITNWENDRARPEVETIRVLCSMLLLLTKKSCSDSTEN